MLASFLIPGITRIQHTDARKHCQRCFTFPASRVFSIRIHLDIISAIFHSGHYKPSVSHAGESAYLSSLLMHSISIHTAYTAQPFFSGQTPFSYQLFGPDQIDTLLQLVFTISSLSISCKRENLFITVYAFNPADSTWGEAYKIACIWFGNYHHTETISCGEIFHLIIWPIVLPRPAASLLLALPRSAFLSRAKSVFRENVNTNSLHFLLRPILLSRPIVLIRPIVYYRWSSPYSPPSLFHPGIQQNPLFTTAFFPHFSHMVFGGFTEAGQGSGCHRKNINVLLAIYFSRCITALPLLRSSSSMQVETVIGNLCIDDSYLNSLPFYLFSAAPHPYHIFSLSPSIISSYAGGL